MIGSKGPDRIGKEEGGMEWFMYASFLLALLSMLYALEGIKRNKELEERLEKLEMKRLSGSE